MKATAKAHANIALIKYWGKREAAENLPAVGSISLTLKELFTTTAVRFDPGADRDTLVLNGTPADSAQTLRISRFLDLVRKRTGLDSRAAVKSENNFPTGAGLASSASSFAALALAATQAAGINLTLQELSILARQGSGSAARSVFGGFVEMKTAERSEDAFAFQIAEPDYWDLRLLVAVTSAEPKKTGSTEGMNRTAATSPYYRQWVETGPADLQEMREAIRNRDFEKLGELAEYSCLKMHGLALSARPGILYWNGATVEVLQAVREWRRSGIPVYFTIDAGPQVKAICPAGYAENLHKKLSGLPGVQQVRIASPGPAAHLVENQ
ncbi:MAG: diphosphomevalonate decarboxylase [Calditrichia bacterium]